MPPRVKIPPNACVGALRLLICLVNQNDMSVLVSRLFSARLSQKGLDRVLASGVQASPMMPETLPSTRPEVNWAAATGMRVSNVSFKSIRLETNVEFGWVL